MADTVLVGKNFRFDPKRVKRELLELQDQVQRIIAERIRQKLAELLFTLRKQRSKRKLQLERYVSEEMASALANDNAFANAQVRLRKSTKGGQTAYIITVTRGSGDKERGMTGSLFDILDQGTQAKSFTRMIVFPVWTPYNRRLHEGLLEVGERVLLKTKRTRKGKIVPVFARVRSRKGVKAHNFYKAAFKAAKAELIGTVVYSPDKSLKYTIKEADFKVVYRKGVAA